MKILDMKKTVDNRLEDKKATEVIDAFEEFISGMSREKKDNIHNLAIEVLDRLQKKNKK